MVHGCEECGADGSSSSSSRILFPSWLAYDGWSSCVGLWRDQHPLGPYRNGPRRSLCVEDKKPHSYVGWGVVLVVFLQGLCLPTVLGGSPSPSCNFTLVRVGSLNHANNAILWYYTITTPSVGNAKTLTEKCIELAPLGATYLTHQTDDVKLKLIIAQTQVTCVGMQDPNVMLNDAHPDWVPMYTIWSSSCQLQYVDYTQERKNDEFLVLRHGEHLSLYPLWVDRMFPVWYNMTGEVFPFSRGTHPLEFDGSRLRPGRVVDCTLELSRYELSSAQNLTELLTQSPLIDSRTPLLTYPTCAGPFVEVNSLQSGASFISPGSPCKCTITGKILQESNAAIQCREISVVRVAAEFNWLGAVRKVIMALFREVLRGGSYIFFNFVQLLQDFDHYFVFKLIFGLYVQRSTGSIVVAAIITFLVFTLGFWYLDIF